MGGAYFEIIGMFRWLQIINSIDIFYLLNSYSLPSVVVCLHFVLIASPR